MGRWPPGRLQRLGYALGVAVVAIVATLRPRLGPALLAAAVILVLAGAAAIALAQARRGGT